MLVASVQAVVACYVTAPRVCTLVLFIPIVIVQSESAHNHPVPLAGHSGVCVCCLLWLLVGEHGSLRAMIWSSLEWPPSLCEHCGSLEWFWVWFCSEMLSLANTHTYWEHSPLLCWE